MPAPKTALRTWKTSVSEETREALRALPGVSVRRNLVLATEDIAPMAMRMLGSEGTEVRTRLRPCGGTFPSIAFPWQVEGAGLLASGKCRGLFHACGLGKTGALLMAANALDARHVLIVTRALGRGVYIRDGLWAAPSKRVGLVIGSGTDSPATNAIRKRASKALDTYRTRGADCAVYRTAADAHAAAWAVVVGWETLSDHVDEIVGLHFDIGIFDESHMCKGRTADRTEAAHRLVKTIEIRWIATATPVRDRIRDLPAQWYLAAPEAVCGPGHRKFSDWNWTHRYCDAKPGRWGGLDTLGRSNVPELRRRLRHWFDFKTRKTIAHLLPPVQRRIIRVSNDARAFVRHRDREDAIAHAADVKFEFVRDRVCEALMGGEKVVVVGCRRVWVAKMLQGILDGMGAHPNAKRLWLHGMTGETEVTIRQAKAEEFVRVRAPACIVATMKAISESIDLQDADRLIEAALPETPGDAIQLKGRVQRPGQKRPLSIDSVVAEGTIDEEIEELFLGKLEAVDEAGTNTEENLSLPDDRETAEALSAWLRKSWERQDA